MTADILDNDQISKADQYKPLIIGYHNSQAVRLSDVAQVTDSAQNIRNAGYLNGIPSVTVIIFRQPGANIIQTNAIDSQSTSISAGGPSARHQDYRRPGPDNDHQSFRQQRGTDVDHLCAAGDPGCLCFSAQLAIDIDSHRGCAGIADWHLRGDVGVRL